MTKKDFETVAQRNENLAACMKNLLMKGHCYEVCFHLCKSLEKGSIEFCAVKNLRYKNDTENEPWEYTMHVLFVSNGWAFDTYSERQYPVEKLHEIFNAQVCTAFDYDGIRDKTYEDFKDEQHDAIKKWADERGVYCEWNSSSESDDKPNRRRS